MVQPQVNRLRWTAGARLNGLVVNSAWFMIDNRSDARPSVRGSSVADQNRVHASDRHAVASLVGAAQRGDRAALAGLHQLFAPLVHAVLLARVPYHDAQDLTQDVFMQAMHKLHTLRDPQAVGPWLMTLTRRAAADFHRHRSVPVQLTAERATSRQAWDSPDHQQRASAALDAIRSLPEAYQETLILRLVEGLTGPQIATCMGMTHGSVRVNLHHGMRMLREKLDEKEETR